jgi:hypothetical protein
MLNSLLNTLVVLIVQTSDAGGQRGRNARLHLPRLLSTALDSLLLDGFLLGDLLLGNHLGKVGLDWLGQSVSA